ncbi:hypothetical protein ACH5RR_006819 [Cinchona calisaya]|uniref:Uncharacterized protein n=1 Tax=Cinchona calisaya TaxID=153742 RepID=A0ABD3AQD9_9GENT
MAGRFITEGEHPVQAKFGNSSSAIMMHKEVVEEHIFIKIRNGESTFWFDNWHGAGPLNKMVDQVFDPHLIACHIWFHHHWSLQNLHARYSHSEKTKLWNLLKDVPFTSARNFAWMLNNDGLHNLASSNACEESSTGEEFEESESSEDLEESSESEPERAVMVIEPIVCHLEDDDGDVVME